MILLGVIFLVLILGVSFLLIKEITATKKPKDPEPQSIPTPQVDAPTEVHQAEKEDKFSIILTGIADAVIALDQNQTIVACNPAAEGLTGLQQGDIVGKQIDSVLKFFFEERQVLSQEYCPSYNTKNVQLVTPSKKVFVNMMVKPIEQGAQANLYVLLTLHDLTEEKSLEDMKLDFVSMAAHELRTPLTSLRGYLTVFMQDNKGKFSDEQLLFLNRMNISAQQLTSLVENLLSVSRIERGAFTIRTEPLDWVATVREVVDTLLDRAKDRKIDLTFSPPSQNLIVAADKLRIAEVLTNLLANAITYTQSGGTVKVEVEKKDNEIITHIRDSGQGIPKDALPHLFTKFFRVSGILEQGSKGTGLGLYISKAIVEMHQGKIWVESEQGRGSTFSFSLPDSGSIANG